LLLLLLLLQDVEKMRHAVGLKAYSSQQPLDEFRLEANRAFLLLLDAYRDAVVARLMVPDLNFSLLMGQQSEEYLAPDVLADPQAQQQTGSNGQHAAQQHSNQQPGAGAEAVPGNGVPGGYTNGNGAKQPSGGQQQHDGLQPAATSAGQPSSS
jgi:preprotein translocase subunit SecA